jgi:sRNA-binding carbon storage regulator CsrA
MGLSITRKFGESFLLICREIGPIKVTVRGRGDNPSHIRLSIEAPQNVNILREELLDRERRTDSHDNDE